jgi:pimeloyl-ACP methyl ester carboxylesterase
MTIHHTMRKLPSKCRNRKQSYGTARRLFLILIMLISLVLRKQSTTSFSFNYEMQRHPSTRSSSTKTINNHQSSSWFKMLQSKSILSATVSTDQCTAIQAPLSTGISMKIFISQPEPNNNNHQILLFLHGSFHSGWCWMEYWGPYFTSKGYTVIAPCWRGTEGTYAVDNTKKVKIQEHVADLHSLLQQLPTILESTNNDRKQGSKMQRKLVPPIVITHSFGGLAVMKYLEQLHSENIPINSIFSGVVTICSVPPSGNGPMTVRFLKRSIKDSYKITVGFAMKRCLTNIQLCRELFFDETITDNQITKYQQYFTNDSKATIDLLDLAKQLPSKYTNKHGIANFVLESDSNTMLNLPPIAVMGATDDFIVDTVGIQETASYFGCNNSDTIFINSPHDVMLGSKWENGASLLYQWLKKSQQ